MPHAFIVASALLGQPAPPPPDDPPAEAPAAQAAEPALPAEWHGVWEGTCRIASPGIELSEPFRMELVIGPTDDAARFDWRITYAPLEAGPDTPPPNVRPYALVVTDAEKGLFAIDEGEGVELAQALLGRTMHGRFAVEDVMLTTRHALHEDGSMHVELTSWAKDLPGRDEDTPVPSAVPRSMQTCVLRRAEEPPE